MKRGVSRAGRSANIERGRAVGVAGLGADFRSDTPAYPKHMLKSKFRNSWRTFVRVCKALEADYPFFQCLKDAAGKVELDVYANFTAAIRQIAYRVSVDSADEYLRIGDSTARDAWKRAEECVFYSIRKNYLQSLSAGETKVII